MEPLLDDDRGRGFGGTSDNFKGKFELSDVKREMKNQEKERHYGHEDQKFIDVSQGVADGQPGGVGNFTSQRNVVTHLLRATPGFRDGILPTPVNGNSRRLHEKTLKAARNVRAKLDPLDPKDRADPWEAAEVINNYRQAVVDEFSHHLQGIVDKRYAMAKIMMMVAREMGQGNLVNQVLAEARRVDEIDTHPMYMIGAITNNHEETMKKIFLSLIHI